MSAIGLLLSTSAQAGVVHIDNPVFPTTSLPFAVNTSNVTQYGGTGNYNDDASAVCQALGLGLSQGPYDQDFTPVVGTSIYVSSEYSGLVDLEEVITPTHPVPQASPSATPAYQVLSQIDCIETTTPLKLQVLGYFSAADVQGLMGSALPVRFYAYEDADPFCKTQGFDRAGSYSYSDGLADEGTQTTVAYYTLDQNNTYSVQSQGTGYPQGVVCTVDDPGKKLHSSQK